MNGADGGDAAAASKEHCARRHRPSTTLRVRHVRPERPKPMARCSRVRPLRVPKASAWGLGLVLRNTSCLSSLSSPLGAREYPSRRPEQPARPTLTQLSLSLSRPATLDHGSYILRERYPPVDQPLPLPSELGQRDRERARGRGGRYPSSSGLRSIGRGKQPTIDRSISLSLFCSLRASAVSLSLSFAIRSFASCRALLSPSRVVAIYSHSLPPLSRG